MNLLHSCPVRRRAQRHVRHLPSARTGKQGGRRSTSQISWPGLAAKSNHASALAFRQNKRYFTCGTRRAMPHATSNLRKPGPQALSVLGCKTQAYSLGYLCWGKCGSQKTYFINFPYRPNILSASFKLCAQPGPKSVIDISVFLPGTVVTVGRIYQRISEFLNLYEVLQYSLLKRKGNCLTQLRPLYNPKNPIIDNYVSKQKH